MHTAEELTITITLADFHLKPYTFLLRGKVQIASTTLRATVEMSDKHLQLLKRGGCSWACLGMNHVATSHDRVDSTSGVAGGGARAPPTFLICWTFWKNPWKSGKEIPENLRETSENLGKIPKSPGKNGAQRCLTSKMAANVRRKTQLEPFLEVTRKTGFHCLCGRKYVEKRLTKTFRANSGKFGRKSFAPPKMCLLKQLWTPFRVGVPGFWIPINFPFFFCSIPSLTRSISSSNSPRRSSGAQLARTKVASAFMSAWRKLNTNTI